MYDESDACESLYSVREPGAPVDEDFQELKLLVPVGGFSLLNTLHLSSSEHIQSIVETKALVRSSSSPTGHRMFLSCDCIILDEGVVY